MNKILIITTCKFETELEHEKEIKCSVNTDVCFRVRLQTIVRTTTNREPLLLLSKDECSRSTSVPDLLNNCWTPESWPPVWKSQFTYLLSSDDKD